MKGLEALNINRGVFKIQKNCFHTLFFFIVVEYQHIFSGVVEYPKMTPIVYGYSATIEPNPVNIRNRKNNQSSNKNDKNNRIDLQKKQEKYIFSH